MSKGNYDQMVFKRGSHAVSRELRLLVPYGGFVRDDTWVDWKRATGRNSMLNAKRVQSSPGLRYLSTYFQQIAFTRRRRPGDFDTTPPIKSYS